MKISEQQTLPFGETESICSQEAGRANQFQQPGNEKEKMIYATCGQKTLEQFGKFNRASSWAKTFAALLIGMEGWYSTRCNLTWKLKATKCSRFYFLLQVSTPRIGGIESSLLPTAQTQGLKVCEQGKTKFMNLGLLPTPKASDGIMGLPRTSNRPPEKSTHLATRMKYAYNNLMPTPNASDYGGTHNQSLNDLIALKTGQTSQLNPLFVGEMMGFPVGWLTLPFLQKDMEQELLKENKHMVTGERKA